MKYSKLIAVLIALVVGFGCAIFIGAPAEIAASKTVPRRVVTLSPAITEMVFAIGAGRKVVGRSDWTDWPDEALKLPSCGGWLNPNFETITSLKTDLLIVQGKHEKVAGFAAQKGIRFANIKITGIDSIMQAVIRLGQLLGEPEGGIRLADSIHTTRRQVSASVKDLPSAKVFLVTWRQHGELRNIGTVGGGQFLDEAIEVAGGKNIFSDDLVPYPKVSKEVLIIRAPEIIIELRPGENLSKEEIKKIRDDWNVMPMLPAVKSGRVYVLTENYMMIPGPRVVDLLKKLARTIHPEAIIK